MAEAGQVELSPQVIALLNPVPSQRARLLLAQGDVPAAAQWTAAAGLSPDDEPDYPREPAYLVLARVLLAQNDAGPALTLLQRLLDAAASQGRVGSTIEIQALRALALAVGGDHASALGGLTEALTLAFGSSPTRARRCAPCSPSCPPPGRASSTGLAASTPATWPRSCAPAARQAPRCRGEPPPRRRAWPSR
jgi:hypothetical protein